MDNDRYARYGALTGIVFVVLLVIGFLIVTPTPPDLDSPVDEWSQYYIDNQDAIRAALVLVTASLFFFIWFLGSIASALRLAFGNPRLPTVAVAGGITFTATLFVAITATAVAAHRPDEVSPELTRALNDVAVLAGVPMIAGLVAFFGATAVVILRTDILPPWLGWLSAVAAVVQPLTFGALFTDSGAFAADGELALFLPLVVGLVTIVAISITLAPGVGPDSGLGVTDRIRGAVTGAAAGARGERPPGP
jgi:hypothetical protein